jgi:hypothetical protein
VQSQDESTQIFDEALEQLNQIEHGSRKRIPDGAIPRDGFGSILAEAKTRTDERIEGHLARGPFTRAMPRVVFDYIDGTVLDAIAFTPDRGSPIIAFSACGVAAIHQTVLRLMSSPNVLQDIGDVRLERPDLPFIPFSIDFDEMGEYMARSGVTMGDYMPADHTREMVARTMADFAVDFIISHEFRHHQAGHVVYWGDVSASRSMRELQSDLATPELAMISQALEMDADCYAIKSVLHHALWVVENLDRLPRGWRAALPDAEQALFLSIMAPYVVFKLFAMADRSSEAWEVQSHPAPALRGLMIQATAMECLKRWGRDDLTDKLPAVLPKVIDVGERQFASLARLPLSLETLVSAVGPVGQQHVCKILKAWAVIEEPLTKFSYVSLGEGVNP